MIFICSLEPTEKRDGKVKFMEEMAETVYMNQIDLVLDCLSKVKMLKLGILGREIISKIILK